MGGRVGGGGGAHRAGRRGRLGRVGDGGLGSNGLEAMPARGRSAAGVGAEAKWRGERRAVLAGVGGDVSDTS